MEEISTIISAIEYRWQDLALSEILKTAEDMVLSDIYVAGFCLFYVDYTEFFPPHLALNTEQHDQDDRLADKSNRWWPCEWKIRLDQSSELIFDDYDRLARALSDESDDVWESAVEEHYRAIARVSKYLTSTIRMSGNRSFTKSFVVGIFEYLENESEYSRLVRLSIDREQLANLDAPRW